MVFYKRSQLSNSLGVISRTRVRRDDRVNDSVSIDSFSIGAKQLEIKLNECGDHLFDDLQESPLKSVLLYYLNSGYFRFDQYKEYGLDYNGRIVDVHKVIGEIRNEQLTKEELGVLMKKFFTCHSYVDGNLYGCGSCGYRLLERVQDPEIKYHTLFLKEKMAGVLKYTHADEVYLLHLQTQKASIPVNEKWDMKEINAAQVRSEYESRHGYGHFHIHLELISLDGNDNEFTMICSTCWKHLVNVEVPALSVKGGIDFGWYRRLGLELPNLHEQIILSPYRLFNLIRYSTRVPRGN